MNLVMYIWLNLPVLKAHLGWTTKDLAEQLGVSYPTALALENNPQNFNKQQALLLFVVSAMLLNRKKMAVDDLMEWLDGESGSEVIISGLRELFSDSLWRAFYLHKPCPSIYEKREWTKDELIELSAELVLFLESELCRMFKVDEMQIVDFQLQYEKEVKEHG